jgi:hypothetical protein
MTLLSIKRDFQSRFRFAFLLLLLVGAGIVFRSFLAGTLNNTLRDNMNTEWVAMKGVLQIRNGAPKWFYDSDDPDQAYAIARLKRVFLLSDSQGSMMEVSDVYAALNEDTPQEIEAAILSPSPSWKVRKDAQGISYLIRSGVVYSSDNPRSPYFVAIGRPLVDNHKILDKFTQLYIGLIAIMIFCVWLLDRRDLQASTNF